MVITLKASKGILFALLFFRVLWNHSPNFSNTPCIPTYRMHFVSIEIFTFFDKKDKYNTGKISVK